MASRSSSPTRLSEAERTERRQRDRERLEQAAEQLLTSEGWQRWVRVRAQAGLRRLSLSNQLLVAMACPEATFVAGFKAWLRLGYAVRRGERAIPIIAPLPVKERDRVSGEETGETRLLFKTVFVFDRLQVDPIDGVEQALLEPPSQPLTGGSHAHLLAPLQAFTESLGFTVSLQSIPGATGGWCDPREKRIVVDSGSRQRAAAGAGALAQAANTNLRNAWMGTAIRLGRSSDRSEARRASDVRRTTLVTDAPEVRT